ncbi:hypothetical protein E1286_11145 [Nonomuraea terrae]|uniref:Uncharacterized protein n=1 Tax=Nonomuraea terrae TaxID=2530383 RepID=A0A4R4YZR2_9ACTN|nr:hypothetical protein [Nonomuraea terrae]TDD51003.1 hypothetical protein E1286_11145 [Nonomuraea terrae]
MQSTATGVNLAGNRTPRFEGWNLAPLAGMPQIGLRFVGRLNAIADTWRDSTGILGNVLRDDSDKIIKSAANYRAANLDSGKP